ncbi:AIM24 family protein [Haloarchaeobius sp. HRN-SO-5]|uniref:AIM24 family protein n=1 Tax=Haloarchaeobius sp. HRN-SO-5 TaxID=3446118 RepID=UPI003EBA9351
MDLDEFKTQNAPREGGDVFQLENSKLLDVDVNDPIMAKAGSMIGYQGEVSFERKSSGGLKGMIKKKATGEGSTMMKATGNGQLYLADQGKNVQILELDPGEELSVNGNDVLAFEDKIGWDIKTIGSISGASAGGLFNVFLEGPGYIAITTHGDPLVMETPVRTDPQATVAWSGNVSPSTHTDHNLKSLIGRSSGETYQLDFSQPGGFVIVQPYEEVSPQQ